MEKPGQPGKTEFDPSVGAAAQSRITAVENVYRLGTETPAIRIGTKYTNYKLLRALFPPFSAADGSIAQDLEQEVHVMADLGHGVAQFGDLATSVQNRRVVASSEVAADLRERKLC